MPEPSHGCRPYTREESQTLTFSTKKVTWDELQGDLARSDAFENVSVYLQADQAEIEGSTPDPRGR